MTDRMQKIAETFARQAGIVYEERPELGTWTAFDCELKQFAELIVAECAEQSMSIGRYNTPSGITPDLSIAIAIGLKKHFGVEE